MEKAKVHIKKNDMVMVDRPDVVNEVLVGFLKEVDQ